MSDVVDNAYEEQQIFMLAAIKNAKNRLANTGNPSCVCWHCGEKTGDKRRWCDADCRNDWSAENE